MSESRPKISSAEIDGWPKTVNMDNSVAGICVSPEAGRIISYSFHCGENLLFVNRSELGKIPEKDSAEWINFGGIRLDLAPQSFWAKSPWGKSWPPPPILNSEPWSLSCYDHVIEMLSVPDLKFLGIQISVRIGLIKSSSIVRIDSTIKNITEVPLTLANWIVVQLAAISGESEIYLPAPSGDSRFSKGYSLQMGSQSVKPAISSDISTLPVSIVYCALERKFGFDLREWIVFRKSGESEICFALWGDFDAAGSYPDDNSHIELYFSEGMPYVELEMLGLMRSVEAGGSISDNFKFAAATCSGKVVELGEWGVACEPIRIDKNSVKGRLGLFYEGFLVLSELDNNGDKVEIARLPVSPREECSLDFQLSDDISLGSILVEIEQKSDLAKRIFVKKL
ncbi:MAG TPA: hypothetical protein PKW68_00105 [bacterium]|nr:hypothetical protein [bacterium]